MCSKTTATGDTPAKRKVRDEMFNERYQAASKKFLKELRNTGADRVQVGR